MLCPAAFVNLQTVLPFFTVFLPILPFFHCQLTFWVLPILVLIWSGAHLPFTIFVKVRDGFT